MGPSLRGGSSGVDDAGEEPGTLPAPHPHPLAVTEDLRDAVPSPVVVGRTDTLRRGDLAGVKVTEIDALTEVVVPGLVGSLGRGCGAGGRGAGVDGVPVSLERIPSQDRSVGTRSVERGVQGDEDRGHTEPLLTIPSAPVTVVTRGCRRSLGVLVRRRTSPVRWG